MTHAAIQRSGFWERAKSLGKAAQADFVYYNDLYPDVVKPHLSNVFGTVADNGGDWRGFWKKIWGLGEKDDAPHIRIVDAIGRSCSVQMAAFRAAGYPPAGTQVCFDTEWTVRGARAFNEQAVNIRRCPA